MAGNEPIVVLMAGGSGRRFWPASTQKKPKQYLNFFLPHSLLEDTLLRFEGLASKENTYVCSTQDQKKNIEDVLPGFENLILEPEPRNTLACVMLSVFELIKRDYSLQTPLVLTPADHFVKDVEKFRTTCRRACDYAKSHSAIVTLGIEASSPHTGYGYIERGENIDGYFNKVNRFTEKPNRELAEKFISSKNYLWNSGIFVLSLGTAVDAFEKHVPEAWEYLKNRQYSKIQKTPIDIAVIEKSNNVVTTPLNVGWTDLGSWNSIEELIKKDDSGNAISKGQVVAVESRNNFVEIDSPIKVTLFGVENLLIVESEGTLLITQKTKDQEIRKVAERVDP